MGLKNKSDTILVSFDYRHGDIPVLIVGRKGKGEVDIINAFKGDEAKGLYKKLIGKKESENQKNGFPFFQGQKTTYNKPIVDLGEPMKGF